MTLWKNLVVALVAASALALAGCSSSNDSAAVEEPAPPPQTTDPEPAPPSDLESTQAAAMAATDAAKAASDAASAAADGAKEAAENLATLQTGEMAAMHVTAASDAADTAMAEYMKAKTASDAAAAATLASEAGMALADAEAAQMAAEAAQETAEDSAEMAADAAMMELKIDGSMKSVGDSSVDDMAGPSSVSSGSGDDLQTAITGLIANMNPMGTGDMIDGRAYTPAVVDDLNADTTETPAPAMPYRQAAAERTFPIGKTLDSSDDMARLMTITHYAGTNTVRPFRQGTESLTGTRAGHIDINDETKNVPLRSEGMFVPAGAPGDGLTHDLVIGAGKDDKPMEVFSFVNPNNNERSYATLTSTSTNGGTTTYTYATGADISAAAGGPDGPDSGTEPDDAQVAVPIPGPEAYAHINFGVWVGLGDADAAGAQDLAGMGIGFVQNIGDGMTGADMPNAGTVIYNGNWAAVVIQGAGDESGALEHGKAELTANLDDAKLTADLNGLATLEGAIDGSAFEGSTATVAADDNTYGLTPGAGFEGSFSGGFYGPGAAEAGGVFDFSSEGSGSFRGAFGGVQDD